MSLQRKQFNFIHLTANLVFLIRIQAVVGQSAECIILSPINPSSFDSWISCGDQRQILTRLEFVDVDVLPYRSDSLFVFTNTGSGSFCMDSPYANTISEELFSEVVFRTISTTPQSLSSFQIHIYGTEDDPLVTYSKEEDGSWSFLKDWMMPVPVYKIRITAEINEGDSVFFEELIVTDLQTSQPECQLEQATEPPITVPPATTEFSSSSSQPPQTTEPATTNDSPTTESEDGGLEGPTTTPSEESSTNLWDEINPENLEGSEDKSNHITWMVIAIVFMSLFLMLMLVLIYCHAIPVNRSGVHHLDADSKSKSPESGGANASSKNVSKLPRLYVSRLRENVLITGQQKVA